MLGRSEPLCSAAVAPAGKSQNQAASASCPEGSEAMWKVQAVHRGPSPSWEEGRPGEVLPLPALPACPSAMTGASKKGALGAK